MNTLPTDQMNTLPTEIEKMNQLHRLIMETAYCCVVNDISPEELSQVIVSMTKSKLRLYSKKQIINIHDTNTGII